MKKIFTILISFSICLVSGESQKQMEKLMKLLQDQYQIYTIEDLHKLKPKLSVANRTSINRDMSDIVGEWSMDHTNIGMYVTVGTDQSIINSVALMGLDSAEGGIIADHIDYDTELNYLIDVSLFEEDPDYDLSSDNVNDYGYFDQYNNIDNNRDYSALTFAQDYVDSYSSQYNQSPFNLTSEFTLTVNGSVVSGGLGGDNPNNCEINWPEDPYKMAVYSFVSEYVLEEGGSVGCFVDSDTLDQTYENVALDMEREWSDDDDDNDDGDDNYSYGPRIGAYLTDLDPGSGGHVYFDDDSMKAVITYLDVPLFDNSSAVNTFQIQLIYATDEIVISYKDLALTGGLTYQAPGGLAIGISNGDGSYEQVDLSESGGQSYSNPIEGYSVSNNLDMDYKKITFTPNNDYSEYSVAAETITELAGEYSNEITLEDDGHVNMSLSAGFKFYDRYYDTIFINNDGNIGFEDGDATCVCWICDNGDGDCAAQYLAGGDGSGDGEDDGPDFMIMNFDFLNFFAFMFGIPPEGVDNPLLVFIDLEEELITAQGLTPFGQDPDFYFANPASLESYFSIDTIESTITFSGLDLVDTTGTVVLKLDGTIGPGMIDLEAGEETEIPWPSIMNENNSENLYITFFEDSTGIEVEIEDNGYYENQSDTSGFYWYATGDSLFKINDSDYGYDDAWESYSYELSDGNMVLFDEEYPCEDYNSIDECLVEMNEELPMLEGLTDVNEFYAAIELVMMPVITTEARPEKNFQPEKFELYPVYPNPFNPVATIQFDVGDAATEITALKIYDITGRNVAILLNKKMYPGKYKLQWNASEFQSGVYISELISGSTRLTQKMILLK